MWLQGENAENEVVGRERKRERRIIMLHGRILEHSKQQYNYTILAYIMYYMCQYINLNKQITFYRRKQSRAREA